ncbi:MAG: helix-turn-helix domain-containing protein [Treponema sp.]|nr:helix-turn-helix domain-containing protein [Treponema sp.]MBQ7166157.1 helix-turn-helix domain-containing protein [Treponema sp.]
MEISGKAIVERMSKLGEIKEYVMSCGIPSSTISNWKNRDSSPKVSDIVKIAEYKKVSIEWLITGQEPKSPPDSDLPPPEVLELAEDINRLPREYQDILRQNVEAYKKLCFRLEEESSLGIG